MSAYLDDDPYRRGGKIVRIPWDYVEPTSADAGFYDIRVARVEVKTSPGKDGKPDETRIQVLFRIQDEGSHAPVTESFFLPNGGEYDEMRKGTLKKFAQLMRVEEGTSPNLDDFDGCEARVWLKLAKFSKDDAKLVNRIDWNRTSVNGA